MNQNKSLPSQYYIDPEIYEKEKRRILYRNWHYVGHLSQVVNSGDYLTLQLGDGSLIVIRGDDGELRHARNADKMPGFDKSDYYLSGYQVETICEVIFVNLIDMDKYDTEIFDIWFRQYASTTKPENKAYQFDKDASIQDMCFWFRWPTTVLWSGAYYDWSRTFGDLRDCHPAFPWTDTKSVRGCRWKCIRMWSAFKLRP